MNNLKKLSRDEMKNVVAGMVRNPCSGAEVLATCTNSWPFYNPDGSRGTDIVNIYTTCIIPPLPSNCTANGGGGDF